MIITVKNLQQQTFTVEFEVERTVLELKEKIFKERGSEYVVEKQKLIYAGVILEDDRTIASYNVDEKKFIVVMLKRDLGGFQKPDEGGAASTSRSNTSIGSAGSGGSATSDGCTGGHGNNKGSSTIEQLDDIKADDNGSDEDTKSVGSGGSGGAILGPTDSSTSIQSTTSGTSLFSSGSGDSSGSETSHSTYSSGDLAGVFSNTSLQSRAESNLLMGEEYNRSVESMIEMGYSHELVERAMAASFNNPERAVEYLISGIPETNEGLNAPVRAEEQPPVVSNVEISALDGDNLVIPPGADPFELLRDQPQFLQMRLLVYQNPDLLHAVLQQIGQTNPALLQHISENQDAFLNMLNEPIEGQTTGPQYPRRITPGRRAQLAAAARAAAGGDGLHIRPLDTAPGAGGDGPPSRPPPGESGDAGDDTLPRELLPPVPDRAAERRAAAAEAFMRDRAAAAAAVAALTAAATAAVERDATHDGSRSGGGGDGSDADGGGAGREGSSVRSQSPSRNLEIAPNASGTGYDAEGTTNIQISVDDKEAIERLKALGFPEPLVLQAYFACEKDEQLAANFLISSAFDD